MKYIGIDNGPTGSIAIVGEGRPADFSPARLYTKSVLKYTKELQHITRIKHEELYRWVLSKLGHRNYKMEIKMFIERPMVNPSRFKATIPAVMALESVLILQERLGCSHEFMDSKEWQKAMLPKGIEGSTALKKASREIALRLFPYLEFNKKKKDDGDAVLMAEYCRRRDSGYYRKK